jgi:hypothetical protein
MDRLWRLLGKRESRALVLGIFVEDLPQALAAGFYAENVVQVAL